MATRKPKNFDPHTEEMLKRLGSRMKAIRIEKGHDNYEKFAMAHDISRAQYWRYEKGKDLNFSTLVRVIKALDISLAEFFSEGFE
ncbi:transcriptional regulator [Mucilaginibacter sp. PPCGB 2223]|uniref:helix-turn-helix domain-containing protein n=1 Tax=Mucilaginibacter sp. PPCGB 2223 TaxID=1886027 RepID=UPI000826D683|nr:helix-turn-helix transcriptional regulator [Mucilaginibacter sp. PPCGB 2223]OCX54309.1 transcriptional regulator [Mucilaginibacter sp. PPCGB 2223]